jgi:hypothetical protein
LCFGGLALEGSTMSWTVRATLLTMLAAAPAWAAAGDEPRAASMSLPSAACAQAAPQAAGACVVWLAADATSAAASFDRLSAPSVAETAFQPLVEALQEPSATSTRQLGDVSTLGANVAERLSFQGIPLGLWFTALVVVAYALRRCERVWPQDSADAGAVKVGFLTTEAGRL